MPSSIIRIAIIIAIAIIVIIAIIIIIRIIIIIIIIMLASLAPPLTWIFILAPRLELVIAYQVSDD